jgi:hypothetical protein
VTFFFQETYTTLLQERYKDDPSTHLKLNSDLWLDAGLFCGPDRNQVYDIANTMIEEDMQMGCSVLTVGSSQSSLSS